MQTGCVRGWCVVALGGWLVTSAWADAEGSRHADPAQPSGRAALHRELPDDPPAPQQLGPAAVQRAVPVVRGRFTSIQVNVDAMGNNIPNDAANEPSLAIDPTNPDTMVIGWRQFDNVASNFRQGGWGYSHDRGQTWTFPGVLQPGVFRSDPVLEADANGVLYYNSLKQNFLADIYKSTNGGVSWLGPFPAGGGDKAWMAIDRTGGVGTGNLYQAWSIAAGCCGNNTFSRSIDGGMTFSTAIQPPQNPYWGTVTVGPDGELYIVGTSNVSGAIVVLRSLDARTGVAAPTFDLITEVDLGGFQQGFAGGPNPGGLLGQIWIATDHSAGPSRGNVYVFASVDPPGADLLDVMFTRSSDQGQTWSPPVRVNDDPLGNGAYQWFGTMDVAPNGRIDVIWNDTRANPGMANMSELYYSFSMNGGLTWAPNTPVSPAFNSLIGWPNQNKLGDYYDMISDNRGASVAYAATFTGGQDVYFLRIGLDCNNNQRGDEDDIALGSSLDNNGNGIPDECDAPSPAPFPHDRPKNRYVSFRPNNGTTMLAFQISKTGGPGGAGVLGWVGAPDTDGIAGIVSSPVVRVWPEPAVHVGDCPIIPAAMYEMRTTANGGLMMSPPLSLSTVPQPVQKQWGDMVGEFTGLAWTAPNGVVNVNDFLAPVRKFLGAPGAPHVTVTDVQSVTTTDPCLNRLTNIADVFLVIKAFQGDAYPFEINPMDCPVCP